MQRAAAESRRSVCESQGLPRTTHRQYRRFASIEVLEETELIIESNDCGFKPCKMNSTGKISSRGNCFGGADFMDQPD